MLSHHNPLLAQKENVLSQDFPGHTHERVCSSQEKITLAISGRKYDPGKKFPKKKSCDKPVPKKKKAAKMDEPKTDEVVKIPEDKLHLAISGRKYDPGKKFPKKKPRDKPVPKKKKAAKMDEPKTDEVVKIPEDKEPQYDDADDDDDDDSLPDPFLLQEPKRPKMLGTKEDQDEENAQTQTMDTDMPELISSNEEAAPKKIFTTKKPPQKKLPHK